MPYGSIQVPPKKIQTLAPKLYLETSGSLDPSLVLAPSQVVGTRISAFNRIRDRDDAVHSVCQDFFFRPLESAMAVEAPGVFGFTSKNGKVQTCHPGPLVFQIPFK